MKQLPVWDRMCMSNLDWRSYSFWHISHTKSSAPFSPPSLFRFCFLLALSLLSGSAGGAISDEQASVLLLLLLPNISSTIVWTDCDGGKDITGNGTVPNASGTSHTGTCARRLSLPSVVLVNVFDIVEANKKEQWEMNFWRHLLQMIIILLDFKLLEFKYWLCGCNLTANRKLNNYSGNYVTYYDFWFTINLF